MEHTLLRQGVLQFLYRLAPVGFTGEGDELIYGVVAVLIVKATFFTEGLAPHVT